MQNDDGVPSSGPTHECDTEVPSDFRLPNPMNLCNITALYFCFWGVYWFDYSAEYGCWMIGVALRHDMDPYNYDVHRQGRKAFGYLHVRFILRNIWRE